MSVSGSRIKDSDASVKAISTSAREISDRVGAEGESALPASIVESSDGRFKAQYSRHTVRADQPGYGYGPTGRRMSRHT